MTQSQQELVRTTWQVLAQEKLRFADVLYEELFTAEPQLRILFEGPMDEQHRKLVDALTEAVALMDDPEKLRRNFKDLGERHDTYGVRAHHYDALFMAYQAALARLLVAEYTPEVGDAWAAFWDQLKTAMLGTDPTNT